eukprot:360025-Chlamydomonas_euryale.AAC.4
MRPHLSDRPHVRNAKEAVRNTYETQRAERAEQASPHRSGNQAHTYEPSQQTTQASTHVRKRTGGPGNTKGSLRGRRKFPGMQASGVHVPAEVIMADATDAAPDGRPVGPPKTCLLCKKGPLEYAGWPCGHAAMCKHCAMVGGSAMPTDKCLHACAIHACEAFTQSLVHA